MPLAALNCRWSPHQLPLGAAECTQRLDLENGVIYKQLPVVLGYAITANKSEGMTFDAINVVPGYFAPGQLYTALSRARSISEIHIVGELTAKDLIVDIDALRMTVDI